MRFATDNHLSTHTVKSLCTEYAKKLGQKQYHSGTMVNCSVLMLITKWRLESGESNPYFCQKFQISFISEPDQASTKATTKIPMVE